MVKKQNSLSKLELSHRPNIFFGDYQQRLSDWSMIRDIINQEQDPLDILSKIFFYCPRIKTNTDPYKKETWLNGWQLIERNEYDLFDICLLLYYTIKLTDNFKNTSVMIHNAYNKAVDSNNHKFSYIFEINGVYLDTHSMEKMSKSQFDKKYVLHYTHTIENTINIIN